MKERSIIDLDTCKRYHGWTYVVMDITDNPLISYVVMRGSKSGSMAAPANLRVSSLNYMLPYDSESGRKYDGITATKQADGSYHITGKATATRSRTLYRPAAASLPQAPIKLDYYVQTDGNYSDFTWQVGGGTALQGTFPQPEATDYEMKVVNGQVYTRSLIFNYTNGTEYDFYVKAWCTPNRENPTGIFYPYSGLLNVAAPIASYDMVGYNIVLPVINQKVVLSLYPAKNYGLRAGGFDVYYNPDYPFDYHSFSDKVEDLGLPMQLRPYTGSAYFQQLTNTSYYGWRVPIPTQFPVRGIRYMTYGTEIPITINSHSDTPVNWSYQILFDRNMDNVIAINRPEGYIEIYYGTSAPGNTSNYMLYEWILGDPPYDLTPAS